MAGGCQIAKEELELGHELGRCELRSYLEILFIIDVIVIVFGTFHSMLAARLALCTRAGADRRAWPSRS
jgi:hypothetical protein